MDDEVTKVIEPTQTPARKWDYIFHSETDTGYLIIKIDADSKEEAIKLAKVEFEELGDTPDSTDADATWHSGMPVYLGKFNYEITDKGKRITERGEVIDFSSIQ